MKMIEEGARGAFDEFNRYVKIQYDAHHLQHLFEYPIQGGNSLSFFFDVVIKKSARKQFSYYELYSDSNSLPKTLNM
jgi:hypothetical protein